MKRQRSRSPAGGIGAGLTTALPLRAKAGRVRVHEQDDDLRNPRCRHLHLGKMDCGCFRKRWACCNRCSQCHPGLAARKARVSDGKVFASSRLARNFRLVRAATRRSAQCRFMTGCWRAGGRGGCLARAPSRGRSLRLAIVRRGKPEPARDPDRRRGRQSTPRSATVSACLRFAPARLDQFGYRALIPAETAAKLTSEIGRGALRKLERVAGGCSTRPCTDDLAYVQLTSLKGDDRGNQVPIDRDFCIRCFRISAGLSIDCRTRGAATGSRSSAPAIGPRAALSWSAMPQADSRLSSARAAAGAMMSGYTVGRGSRSRRTISRTVSLSGKRRGTRLHRMGAARSHW